ncbi:MAG: hypothetical protein KJ626_04570 [Verrucomicrobia bacterium]|nr:hypothetical protein [Verrucomicrobiota bacterium]
MTRYVQAAACTVILLILTGCQVMELPERAEEKMYVKVKEDGAGRYWFSRGDQEFLSLGVCTVLPREWNDFPVGESYNVMGKSDGNLTAWSDAVQKRLIGWKFNTLGAFSHYSLFNSTSLYHTRVIWFRNWYHEGRDMRLVDVFDTNFVRDVEVDAAKIVPSCATNEYLLGYFVSNELPWYGERGWPTSANVSMISRYMELQKNAPGKERLVSFLKEYYEDDFSALTAEWITKAESFSDLLNEEEIIARVPRHKLAVSAWCGVVAETYYRMCHDAIRRHDPDHLILGSRFATKVPVPVIEACGKYSDVVSVNHYSRSGDFDEKLMGAVAALTGKPVLITEFSWRAEENSSGCRNNAGADVTVQTQQDRADAFERYATELLKLPYMLGYHWFQYADQPPKGRGMDGEDSNYGLVDIADKPYEILLDSLSEINSRSSEIHAGSTEVWPEYDPAVLAEYREIGLPDTDALADPLLFADVSSGRFLWGDYKNGAKLSAEETGGGRLKISVTSGGGWGCGVALTPQIALVPPSRRDGNILGAREIVLKVEADTPLLVGLTVNESGNGPPHKQVYEGEGDADGESFTHLPIRLEEGPREIVFRLADLTLNPNHGNQRGNGVVDTDAIASIDLYFPPGQTGGLIRLESIQVR